MATTPDANPDSPPSGAPDDIEQVSPPSRERDGEAETEAEAEAEAEAV